MPSQNADGRRVGRLPHRIRAAGRVLVVPFVIVVFAMNVAGGPSHGSIARAARVRRRNHGVHRRPGPRHRHPRGVIGDRPRRTGQHDRRVRHGRLERPPDDGGHTVRDRAVSKPINRNGGSAARRCGQDRPGCAGPALSAGLRARHAIGCRRHHGAPAPRPDERPAAGRRYAATHGPRHRSRVTGPRACRRRTGSRARRLAMPIRTPTT